MISLNEVTSFLIYIGAFALVLAALAAWSDL